MFWIVLLAALVWYFITLVILFMRAKRMTADTVIALTGGLGTGKTKLGVEAAIHHHRSMLFKWRLGLLDKKIKDPKTKKVIKVRAERPWLLSNIPIRISRKYYSFVLKYEHLTLQERIPEYSTVFIDEIGQFADQYSFDNPFVIQYLQEFIRFFRHYIDGRLIITDQTSSNIVVAIRRRLNVIYNLHDFSRTHIFYHTVKVSTILITEDLFNINDSNKDDEDEYFISYLPLKFFKKFDLTRLFHIKHYDSRCYSVLYEPVKYGKELNLWTDYKTNYLIDLPNNENMKKQFKKDGYIPAEDMLKYLKEWREANSKVVTTTEAKQAEK